MITAAKGSTSASACACPPGQFDAGQNICVPCSVRCPLGEYRVSECDPKHDLVCAPCQSCYDMDPANNAIARALPQYMCDGLGSRPDATGCQPCRTDRVCGDRCACAKK